MYNEVERIIYAYDVEEGIYRENEINRIIQEQRDHESERQEQENIRLKQVNLELKQRIRESEARDALNYFLKSLNISKHNIHCATQ